MRVLNDFRCSSCEETTEHFVSRTQSQVICHCGGTADKVLRPIRSTLDPISGSFPGATDKWARDRQKKMEKERKASQ